MKMPEGQAYTAYENGDGASVRSSTALDATTPTTWQKCTTGTKGIILKIILFLVFFWVSFIIGYGVGYSIHKCDVVCQPCGNTTSSTPAI